jgi:hypothetical protein
MHRRARQIKKILQIAERRKPISDIPMTGSKPRSGEFRNCATFSPGVRAAEGVWEGDSESIFFV